MTFSHEYTGPQNRYTAQLHPWADVKHFIVWPIACVKKSFLATAEPRKNKIKTIV